jgi:hypothetical protein
MGKTAITPDMSWARMSRIESSDQKREGSMRD